MTVIRPNSIAGINSITVQSGQALNVHDASGNLIRSLTNESGISTFSGINIGTAATIFANGNATFSGIVTATSFVGDGSGLTGAGPSLANGSNDRVVTATGANALTGEANLTFTGSILTVTNSSGASELTLVTPNNTDGGVYFNDGTNSGALTYQHSDNSMRFRVNTTEKVRITSSGDMGVGTDSPDRKLDVSGTGNVYGKFQSTDSTGAGIELKDTGQRWLIQADGAGSNESLAFYDLGNTAYRVHMKDNGNLEIVNGDLKVASGHGIDFSATANSSGTMGNELLADYEEGTFTMTLTGSSSNPSYTTTSNGGHYVRVGNLVSLYYLMVVNGVSSQGSGNWQISGIPFSHSNTVNAYRSNGIIGYNDIFDFEVNKCYINNSDNVLIIPNGVTQSNQTYAQNPLSTGYFSITITYITDS